MPDEHSADGPAAVERRARAHAIVHGEVVPASPCTIVRTYRTQAETDAVINLPEVVLDNIRGRLSANSWITYKQAWARFLHWCQETGRTPLPATLATVLSYLAHLATVVNDDGERGLSASSMRVWLAAAKRFHSYGNPPPEWTGGHLSVSDFVIGYEKARARNPDNAPKRATGARQVILRALLDATPADTVTGIRDRAVLLLGYYMAARRSELAGLTHRSWRMSQDGLEVYVGYSKTDQAGEGVWVAVPANEAHPQYCAVRALMAWMDVCRTAGLVDGPLFRPIDRYGNIRAVTAHLSGTAFETVIRRAADAAYARAKAAGQSVLMALLDPDKVRLSPHSLRRGFATDARASMWDLLDISRHGRWSPQSKVVHIYIEEADRWLRHATKPVLL